jgi:RNA polymerase sigma factor (sigma-70 family)
MDDLELLRRYADAGSQDAFAELVRRHVNLVYSAALRRVGDDAHLAGDVTQKVFIALARQAASVSRRRTVAGWLYTASRYTAAHTVRTERRRRERERKAQLMNDILSGPEADPLDWERIRPELDSVMDQLGELDREAVILRYLSGRPFAEVGSSLGLSEEAARKRVERALERLRRLLARRGVAGPAASALGVLISQKAVSAAPASLVSSLPGTAMAAAAGSQGGLLAALAGMKGSLAAAAILAAAAAVDLAAVRSAAGEIGQARRAEARLAAAQARYGRDREALRGLEAAVAEGEADRRTLVAALGAAASGGSQVDPRTRGRQFLEAFPEARALFIEAGLSGTLRTNGLFYRLAGFTPSQVEQFNRLMAEAWVDNLALTPAGFESDGVPGDDQVRGIVGEEGLRKFDAYNQMLDAYRWAGAAARETALGGAALTPEQIEGLARIMADSSSLYRGGRALNRASVDGAAALASVDWPAAMERARAMLSPDQWRSAEPVFLGLQLGGAVGRGSGNAPSP